MKKTWEFQQPADPNVNCTVKITGNEEKTIKVTIHNRSAWSAREPLTVEIIQDAQVIETLEDATTITVEPRKKLTQEYKYTPQGNGWMIRVSLGED